jgi:hypothetical protein
MESKTVLEKWLNLSLKTKKVLTEPKFVMLFFLMMICVEPF